MDPEQSQQLQAHITQQLQTGLTPDEINQQLVAAGWPANFIAEGFQAVQAAVLPTAMQTVPAAATGHAGADPTLPPPSADGRRRGRIKTGWLLFKQSLAVLRGNPYLLRFLLMTYLGVLVSCAVFFAIYWFGDKLLYKPGTSAYAQSDSNLSLLGWVVIFFNYLVIYFIINFYAAALAGNMLDIFDGKHKSFGEYTAAARSKASAIFVFSLMEATLGMLLRFVVERIRFVGWILSWLIGTAWSLGTMFVLPIIMTSDVGAPKAVKQSVGFFKETWGENITAKVTVNGPLLLLNLALIGVFFLAIFGVLAIGSFILMLIMFFVFIFLFVTLSIVGSFANSLINVSLFYYANYHKVPSSFDAELLNQVFVTGKRGFLGRKKSA